MEREALEALFHCQSVGIALIDLDLRYVRVNDAIAAITRRPRRRARRAGGWPGSAQCGRDHRSGHEARDRDRARPSSEPRCTATEFRPSSTMSRSTTSRGSVPAWPLSSSTSPSYARTQATLATRLHITELISELSASFIDRAASEVDRGIVGALRALGEGLDIDQTFIARLSDDREDIDFHPPVVQSRSSPTVCGSASPTRSLPTIGRFLE